ncbi:MAG: hypothetical protein JJW01_00820 [Alphaproteobacteria bacterium]|nr:hypothetical protein [Rickettsiales bacterium]
MTDNTKTSFCRSSSTGGTSDSKNSYEKPSHSLTDRGGRCPLKGRISAVKAFIVMYGLVLIVALTTKTDNGLSNVLFNKKTLISVGAIVLIDSVVSYMALCITSYTSNRSAQRSFGGSPQNARQSGYGDNKRFDRPRSSDSRPFRSSDSRPFRSSDSRPSRSSDSFRPRSSDSRPSRSSDSFRPRSSDSRPSDSRSSDSRSSDSRPSGNYEPR